MNKKWIIVLAVIALIFLPYLSEMNAQCGGGGNGGNGGNGNGNGHGGNGNGNGNGIINGTAFTFSGTVTDVGVAGNGIVIDGSLTVTGLGPFSYWESLNIGRPVVGDAVSGNGYTVDYNGIEHNVLTDITVNGKTVELRDADGYPFWRGNGGNGQGGGYGNGGNEWCGGGYGSYENILEGTPFVIKGDVISSNSMGNSGFNGNGLVIATASGNETVNGLGPYYYWDNLAVVRPVVGDRVKAEGFTVFYNTVSVNVLMSITLSDGVKVQLRDPDTGAPLWRR